MSWVICLTPAGRVRGCALSSLLAAVGVTWAFAILGVILRLVENDIFALLTTMSTALLTLWLFYALREIVKNYRYTKMQQAFEKNRW